MVEGGDRSQMLEMDISHGIKDEQGKSKSCLHIRLKAAVPWDGRVGC